MFDLRYSSFTGKTVNCMVRKKREGVPPQSIQSARFSLKSSESAPPAAPFPPKECCPLPLVPGGEDRLAGEGVVGANSDKGNDTLIF